MANLFQEAELSLLFKGGEKSTSDNKLSKMAAEDTSSIVLFDVDGTLTAPRQVTLFNDARIVPFIFAL